MTAFSGTLWSSIKEVKAPFMFDGEHGIALHAMQGTRASSRTEGYFSWSFSSCGGNLGYIIKFRQGWHFKTRVCSATSGLKSSCQGHLGILGEVLQAKTEASQGDVGDPRSHSSCHTDIGIPINFQVESGILSF